MNVDITTSNRYSDFSKYNRNVRESLVAIYLYAYIYAYYIAYEVKVVLIYCYTVLAKQMTHLLRAVHSVIRNDTGF